MPTPVVPSTYACLKDGSVLQVSHIENDMVYGDEVDIMPAQRKGDYQTHSEFLFDIVEEPEYGPGAYYEYRRAPLVNVRFWWDLETFETATACLDADMRLLSYAS